MQLPTIWRGAVLPEWIDRNGHMNAGFYMVVFDDATAPWHDLCGIDHEYRTSHRRSTFSIEGHITWDRELREGDLLRIDAQLLAYDDKKTHAFFRLFHDSEGYLAATHELLSIHVDMESRRSAVLPPQILARLEALWSEHQTFEQPTGVGRVIRTKPRP
jgi:acyl-CoA thioester hydrolase